MKKKRYSEEQIVALSQNLFAARIPFFPMGLSSNDQFQMAAF